MTLYLHADQGGAQQIGARISYNEIDLVLFFCDPSNPGGFDDINKIRTPVRSVSDPVCNQCGNRGGARSGLRRGDLDWRNIVNPKRR